MNWEQLYVIAILLSICDFGFDSLPKVVKKSTVSVDCLAYVSDDFLSRYLSEEAFDVRSNEVAACLGALDDLCNGPRNPKPNSGHSPEVITCG